jgi:predicted PurR-regulated permease PerM
VANQLPSSPWQRSLFVGGSLALVLGLLYWARPILIPIVLAVLLTFVLSPLVGTLQRWRLGRVPASLLVVFLLVCFLTGLTVGLAAELKGLLADLPQHEGQILKKIEQIQESGEDTWLDRVRDALHNITRKIQGSLPRNDQQPAPVPVQIESPGYWGVLQSVVTPAMEGLVNTALVIVLVAFMLIHREDLRNRLIRLWGDGSLTRMTRALDDASQRISRYLFIQVLLNGGYGVVYGLGLFFIGVPYALLWGALTALLRYIPYLGAWIAAGLPLLMSIAVLPGLTQPLLVLVLVLVLELITANVLEPLLYGQSIGVSGVAMLVSVVFWGWLWGPLGMVLAAPLTACLVVLGRYIPLLESVSVLLGDEPALEPYIRYYQRLVARDPDEAGELVEQYAHEHRPEEVFDQLLVPSLVLTKQGLEGGELAPHDAAFIYQMTREALDDLPLETPRTEAGDGRSAVLVLGCPARDEADELALELFGRLLDPAKYRLEVLSTKTLSAELVSRVEQEQAAVVCIASLPPHGINQARYLCKRLRAYSSELKILVGCWGVRDQPDTVRERLQPAGADYVGFTLRESREQLQPLLTVLANGERKPDLAHSS